MARELRFGWIGFHREGFPALEALLARGTPVKTVVTLLPEQLAQRSASTLYDEICEKYRIPLHKVANINSKEAVELLRSLDLDIIFVIGWSQILSSEALAAAKIGVVGAHASLLPHNRGSAPINWAIIKGERQTGNTLMWLNEGVDTGEIIDQEAFGISPYDTCDTLYDQVAATNLRMISRFVDRVSGGNIVRSAPAAEHPLTPVLPRRRPQDGLVNWTCGSRNVYDFIRAITRPYPGAFSFLEGKRWLIWKCALVEGLSNNYPPGTIVGPVISPDPRACGQAVACSEGIVILLEIEDSDGNVMTGYALSEQQWKGKRWTNE